MSVPDSGLPATLGGRYAKLVNAQAQSCHTLVGLVDLHTHPAAYLGFGTELFYGAPDGDPAHDFVDCDRYHGGWGIGNPRGNLIRQQVVDAIAQQGYPAPWRHERHGWPAFPAWPTWHDRLHQQVRVEMLERAWRGGLRYLVAHAVNSPTLAKLSQTRGPYDDKSAGDAQIAALKEMVAAREFMEIALSPADARDIIGRGKLAIVLGVELDCLGNFCAGRDLDHAGVPFQPKPTDDEVRAEINRLFDLGVRHVFAVHVTDNLIGGAALYEMSFDAANRYQFGSFFAAEPAPAESTIGWTLNPPEGFWHQIFDFGNLVEALSLGFDPQAYPAPPPTSTGHRNARGLQDKGRVALDALMRRGMMIDIDHMSERTVLDTLQFTQPLDYPLIAGHAGIRAKGGDERSHRADVAAQILGRGGMFGIALSKGVGFVGDTVTTLRRLSPAGGIALGSDFSGLMQLPAPRNPPTGPPAAAADSEPDGRVVYRDDPGAPQDALEPCHLGNRREDINRDGVSHIGMIIDLIEDGVSSGLLSDPALAELFNAPEAVISTWEKCVSIAEQMPYTSHGA